MRKLKMPTEMWQHAESGSLDAGDAPRFPEAAGGDLHNAALSPGAHQHRHCWQGKHIGPSFLTALREKVWLYATTEQVLHACCMLRLFGPSLAYDFSNTHASRSNENSQQSLQGPQQEPELDQDPSRVIVINGRTGAMSHPALGTFEIVRDSSAQHQHGQNRQAGEGASAAELLGPEKAINKRAVKELQELFDSIQVKLTMFICSLKVNILSCNTNLATWQAGRQRAAGAT